MIVGFIVNPLAGIGGPKALKGSDGRLAESAIRLGAKAAAPEKARIAVASLLDALRDEGIEEPHLLTCSGPMGEESLKKAGYVNYSIVYSPKEVTAPEDTTNAAREMMVGGADIVLFTGGDGTARDVVAATGMKLPVLGIPSGVKMYSGAFLNTPGELGPAMIEILTGGMKTARIELLDFDREPDGSEPAVAKYGQALTPVLSRVAGGKSEEPSVEEELEGISAYVIDSMISDCLYVMGTGSTVKFILRKLGYFTPVLGIDILINRKLVEKDVTDESLGRLLGGAEMKKVFLILTPLGGNGFILGRGNQQLTSSLVSSLPRENIIIIATKDKMNKLKELKVDTGDETVDRKLKGIVEVVTGYGLRMVSRIA